MITLDFVTSNYLRVAQLGRAFALGAKGCTFDSCLGDQFLGKWLTGKATHC